MPIDPITEEERLRIRAAIERSKKFSRRVVISPKSEIIPDPTSSMLKRGLK